MARLRSQLGALCLAGTLLVVGGCADVTSAPGLHLEKIAAERGPSFSVDGGSLVASAVIGPQGGVIATASGHRLAFPAGAVAQPTEIRMRDDGAFLGVRLEPHGLQFPTGRGPVLSLNLGGAETTGYTVLRIAYVDEDGNFLEVLPATLDDRTLSTRLRHFSGYIAVGH
jgi:hypothetical protein